MGIVGTVMQATRAGIAAFRESMMSADPQGGRLGSAQGLDDWNRWEARRTRYALHWAMYENTAYRDAVHALAVRWKTSRGLYKHVRSLYNPAYRLGEFWAGHLMGGLLDREAGDGESAPSALPILTENAAIRPAIARLWADSNWQVEKETYTRFGAVLGDVALKVVDDTARGQMRMEVVHPGQLKWVDLDPMGNVKAYQIERWQADPRRPAPRDVAPDSDPSAARGAVRYQEQAFRDGDLVVYRTFLDGRPFAWNGAEAEWSEPYGFVPLVLVRHESIGMDWGFNAWQAGSGDNFTEVDDQASGLSDQIRKAIRAPMLLAGVKGPKELATNGADRSRQSPEVTAANPEPARTETPFLYATDPTAKAQHLTFDLKIDEVCGHIKDLLAGIEKNFPELLADTGNLGGTVTAEAIRNARLQASSKVQGRRVPYDDGLVRAQMMALAIGGFRGYRDFEGLDLDSYAAGKLDHQIGHRAVFEVDPLSSIEEDDAFWTAAGKAVDAGVPLVVYLERNGWSEEELANLTKVRDAEAKAAAALAPPAADPAAPPAKGGAAAAEAEG